MGSSSGGGKFLSRGPGSLLAEQGTQKEVTVRRLMIIVFFLIVATVSCAHPQLAAAEEQQATGKTADQKQKEKGAKEEDKEGSVRDGINRAYDEFKVETEEIKTNLKKLNERSTSSSGNESAK
jgi:hypothetical protein